MMVATVLNANTQYHAPLGKGSGKGLDHLSGNQWRYLWIRSSIFPCKKHVNLLEILKHDKSVFDTKEQGTYVREDWPLSTHADPMRGQCAEIIG